MSNRIPSDLELMAYADGAVAPDRAAEIERYLSTSPRARALIATFDELGARVREHAQASSSAAGDVVDNVMTRIDAEPNAPVRRGATVHPLRGAAPIAAATAALALAAGIALLVSRVADGPASAPLAASSGDPQLAPSSALVASAPTPPAEAEDREPGVSVDAVEFGAHAGTIFYVPTDTGTTTVVWLTDDDSGED